MKHRIIVSTLILVGLLLTQGMKADTIKGRVVDAETNEPLPNAEVEYQELNIEGNFMRFNTVRTDSLGRFQFICEMDVSRLTITGKYFGLMIVG